MTNRYREARRALEHVVFGLAAPALTVWTLAVLWAHDGRGEDFRFQYWLAGWRTLHGISPYAGLHAPVDAALAFPYPASTALFFVPFALLHRASSEDLYTAFCLCAPALSLWTLGVRDWRLYGLVMLLAPVVSGWQTANLTLLLGLGMAMLWRFRDRQILASAIAAVLVSLKPFMWPLVLWLLVTRRWRSTVYTVLGVAVIQIASWSVLGFDQIRRFLRVTFSVTHTFRGWGYGIASSAMHLGAGSEVATVAAVIVSVGLVVALLFQMRRNSDSTALVLAVTLALCASPIVWGHYFALLIIPLAVLRPRLSPIWVCLVPLWLCPLTNPDRWQADVALATLLGTFCALVWAAESGSQRRTAPRFLRRGPELAEGDSLAVSVSDA